MDPILRAFNINSNRFPPVLYDIGPKLTPISIRDQVLRAFMLVDRAAAAKIIGPNRPLLIIGGGAAGVTAAITAARRRIQTTIVEQTGNLFSRQVVSERCICPTQYDWPVDHWNQKKFPWTGHQIPLGWSAGKATDIVTNWNDQVKQLRAAKYLTTIYRTRYKSYILERTDPILSVDFDPSLPSGPKRFGMAISCVGQGEETHTIGDYESFPFWSTYLYRNLDADRDIASKPKVFVAGSGDGALQEFLMVTTTAQYARDIYLLLPDAVKSRIEPRIQSAEDQAQRALTLSEGLRDHYILQRLHEEHSEVIDQLEKSNDWLEVVKSLKSIVKEVPGKIEVRLGYPCTHFTTCYALNRFLVLLVARYIQRQAEQQGQTYQCLRQEAKVIEIVGKNDHSPCDRNPPECYGKNHDVIYAAARCDNFGTAGTNINDRAQDPDNPYNVVIVRFGITPATSVFGLPRLDNLRQMPPYYFPA